MGPRRADNGFELGSQRLRCYSAKIEPVIGLSVVAAAAASTYLGLRLVGIDSK